MSVRIPLVRELILAVSTALVIASLLLGVGPALAAGVRDDRVTILGSGKALSVLVTSGSARLLIATGTNRTDFANALEEALPFTARRLDVLLVAGSGANLVVPASAEDKLEPRFVAAIHPLDAGDTARNFENGGPPPLEGPTRFRLGDRVTVTIETAGASEDAGRSPAWRALVQRGRTTMAVLSRLDAYEAFTWTEPIAALVVVQGPVASVAGIDARAIAAPATEMDVATLASPSDDWGPAYAIEVRPGAAVPARFVENGLRLPDEAVAIGPGQVT